MDISALLQELFVCLSVCLSRTLNCHVVSYRHRIAAPTNPTLHFLGNKQCAETLTLLNGAKAGTEL